MPALRPAAFGNGVWLISRSDDVPDPVCRLPLVPSQWFRQRAGRADRPRSAALAASLWASAALPNPAPAPVSVPGILHLCTFAQEIRSDLHLLHNLPRPLASQPLVPVSPCPRAPSRLRRVLPSGQLINRASEPLGLCVFPLPVSPLSPSPHVPLSPRVGIPPPGTTPCLIPVFPLFCPGRSKGLRERFRPGDKRPRVSSVRIAGAVIFHDCRSTACLMISSAWLSPLVSDLQAAQQQ